MLAVLIVSRTYGRRGRSLGGEGKGMRLEIGWKEGVCKRASRRAVPVRQSRLRLFQRQGFSAATARLSRLCGESQGVNAAPEQAADRRRTDGERNCASVAETSCGAGWRLFESTHSYVPDLHCLTRPLLDLSTSPACIPLLHTATK